MFKLEITNTFWTERKENAEYIEKLYSDLQSLLECASSEHKSNLTELVDKNVEDPDPETMLLKPETWCKLLNAHIIDPDGWRGGYLGAKDWNEPITKKEFDQRYSQCTVNTRGYQP